MTHGQYLAHHGILGQKWGKKNGPPYPLDYSKLSPEEKAEAKGKAIKEANIDEVWNNRNEFTTQEVQDVISRFEKMKTLNDLKTDQSAVNRGAKTVEQISKRLGTFAALIESATKIHKGYKYFNEEMKKKAKP